MWSREGQWAPLWEDIKRVAGRIESHGQSAPHFLGAVVLQQQPNETGTIGIRTIIDGQQRLTTLQLFLDAVHEQVLAAGFGGLAKQMQDLVENQEQYNKSYEDKFKVWPTNRDRQAYNEVMSAPNPVDYKRLEFRESRMAQAHEYFSMEVGSWLAAGDSQRRADALVTTVSRYLLIVVIDLLAEEDAQEIFETLNARGTPLTAADLIKNFVFQRLEATPEEAERAYQTYWEKFETPFWEKEIAAGRILHSRSSLFLTQWLVAQLGKLITAREVFSQFKIFVSDTSESVEALLPRIRKSADIYQKFTEAASTPTGSLSRLDLFVYRTLSMDSEVVKPFLLWLENPDLEPVPAQQHDKALECIEGFLVRRSLLRLSAKGYNRLFVDLIDECMQASRDEVGDTVEAFLSKQVSPNNYWPGDAEVRRELLLSPIYRKMARARLRMVLEAIEDYRRGWLPGPGKRLSEQSVSRGTCTIEHVIPQEWRTHWAGPDFDSRGTSRDDLVHLLGNLTLVTQSLNSKVTNGPWVDKQDAFKQHATLLLTSEVIEQGQHGWDESRVHERTIKMIDEIVAVWPVPAGHLGEVRADEARSGVRVTVADLVQAGLLRPGQELFARTQAFRGARAEISEDGGIYVDGVRDETPSGAAKRLTGAQAVAGWWFWLVDLDTEQALDDVRRQYLESVQEETDGVEV